jgi:hypothetical protein
VTKSISQPENRITLTGCPRAEELLNQMRQQVGSTFVFSEIVQGYSQLEADTFTELKDIFGEEVVKKVVFPFDHHLSETLVPIYRNSDRVG